MAAVGTQASAQAAAASAAAFAQQQQLQADAFKRLYPAQFFSRFADEGLRPDGRGLSTPRPVSIGLGTVGAADGSALVKIGSTAVLAGIRLEVAVPPDNAPDRGQIVTSAELPAISRGDWRPGRPSPEAAHLAARVADALAARGALDTRQLCISPGNAVWVLYLDIYVLDASGGLLEAALLAAVAALRDCRLPAVHLTAEGNVERGPDPDAEEAPQGGPGAAAAAAAAGEGRRLELGAAPVCLTCGIYNGQVVVDPDHEEESLMGSRVSVVVDGDGGLLGIYKPGGSALVSPGTLMACIAQAQAWQREVQAQLEEALRQRDEERQQGEEE